MGMKRWLSRISELNHSRTTQIAGIGQKLDNFLPKVFFSAFIRSQTNWPLGVSNWELSKFIILRNIIFLKIY
jgi:hypothetical protein